MIPFLNLFSIFIISFLKLVFVRLKRSVSLFILSGEFSRSYNWEWFPCFFILLMFLLPSEFMKSSYLLWSWKGHLPVGALLCGLCGFSIFLVQGLFSVWMPVASSQPVLATMMPQLVPGPGALRGSGCSHVPPEHTVGVDSQRLLEFARAVAAVSGCSRV